MAPPRSWFKKRSRWTRRPEEHDPLEVPGVLSATELENLLCRERARVERNGMSFSLVVFRIDPQRVSDLRRATEILVERIRAYDTVGLVEGDRVAALLPETDGAGAWVFADAVLAQFSALDFRADCDVYAYPKAAGDATTDDDYGQVVRPEDAGPDGHGPGPYTLDRSAPEDGGERRPMRRTGTDGGAVAPGTPVPRVERTPVAGPVPLQALGAPATRRRPLPEALTTADGRAVRDLAPLFVEPLPAWRRALDVVASACAIVLLSPVLVTTGVLVRVTSPGPIIFWQWRVGRGGRRFRFYKFRSMYQDAEERKNALRIVNEKDGPIFKIKDDPRITPLGRVIRRLSIDELPQLFNVLKGDMTLVGPRPPVVDEVDQYEPWQRQRLDITGGLTCIWQVSGRSEVSFDDWMRMDIRYKQRRSVRLDVKLLWKTIGAVFSGKGAY
ncbi:MAG: sugar transferase [Planctomycetota bacterium]